MIFKCDVNDNQYSLLPSIGWLVNPVLTDAGWALHMPKIEICFHLFIRDTKHNLIWKLELPLTVYGKVFAKRSITFVAVLRFKFSSVLCIPSFQGSRGDALKTVLQHILNNWPPHAPRLLTPPCSEAENVARKFTLRDKVYGDLEVVPRTAVFFFFVCFFLICI